MSHDNYYKNFLNHNLTPRELKNYPSSLLNFSSSDYLGLAKHPYLIEQSREYTQRYGTGASSSRLVTGNFSLYEELEDTLAKSIGKPAALILGTGFQTNTSVLEALLDPLLFGQEPLVFCDRLCHVSLLSGALSQTRIYRFRHNDLTHLQTLLEKYAHSSRPKFILVESIYSMEGDQADLVNIIRLAKQYQAFLYVDDAHAVGVYGPEGFGLGATFAKDIDVVMGTFSKALGSFGGYVACSKTIREYLINRCKGFIYSTGLPPAVLGSMKAALELLPTLNQAREKLLSNAKFLQHFFKQQKLNGGTASTHIVPWIIGEAEKTRQKSQLLEKEKILATAIRPPSVPMGQSRIRFCLSASYGRSELNYLIDTIKKIEETHEETNFTVL